MDLGWLLVLFLLSPFSWAVMSCSLTPVSCVLPTYVDYVSLPFPSPPLPSPPTSCETAHASVQQSLPRQPPLRMVCVPEGGTTSILPQLRHPAHHEHTVPGHPLHYLRVPPRPSQLWPLLQSNVTCPLRRSSGRVCGFHHHTFGRSKDAAEYKRTGAIVVAWEKSARNDRSAKSYPCQGRCHGIFQGCISACSLPDALGSNMLVSLWTV